MILRRSLAVIFLLGALPSLCSGDAGPVQLRATIAVEGPMVYLSDFLPEGESAELRASGKSVELGRTPRAGCERILTADEIEARLPSAWRARGVVLPPRLTVRPLSWTLAEAAVEDVVWRFLRARGWAANELPAALEWPRGERALAPHPDLEVTGSAWDAGRKALALRVGCAKRALCGRFLVLAPALHPLPARDSGSAGLVGSRQLRAAPLARPGQIAMLRLERDGMRISLPVVCLERGGLQQRIRVRERSGHRVYNAVVVAAGFLRAEF